MKHMQDTIVKCPFYKGERRQLIYCEGVQEGSSIHMGFDTQDNFRDYKSCFCKGDYNQCLIAQAMNRKWGYET